MTGSRKKDAMDQLYKFCWNRRAVWSNGAGFDIRDGHGLSISANTFTLMKTHALIVRAASGRLAVTGNSFCNSYIGDGMIRRGTNDIEAGGILLVGTSEITISGNQISGLTTSAVELEGTVKRVIFSSNVLTDVNSGHGGLKDSLIGNNLDGVLQ